MIKFISSLIFLFFCLSSFFYGANFISTKLKNSSYSTKNIVHFTLWNKDALIKDPIINDLRIALLEPQNGSYLSRANIFSQNNKLNDNEINFIIWRIFDIPIPQNLKKSYLWLLESPLTTDIEIHKIQKNFNKIFSWHKPSTNNKNIIYLPIPWVIDTSKHLRNGKKEVLLTILATYFPEKHPLNQTPLSNYSQREKTVIWFLETHPEDIFIYGKHWDAIQSKLSDEARINLSKQYKGYAPDKIEALGKSKFSFIFENTKFESYVSEKIYDAMMARTVPVYSGAPDITQYVPQNCFINFHDFKNYQSLYTFLKNMPDTTYKKYLTCINNFMKHPEKLPNYYKNITKKIIRHLNLK